jgi:ABC-type sugar transport system ATPase subunit
MPTLDLDRINRRFGAVQALDGVGLTLSGAQVHALMGENGAGKSTLIRCLAGLDRPDAGTMTLDGRPLPFGSPGAMRAAGLRFIHQELHPVPGLSVAENMHLDHAYPTRFGLIDWRALNRVARDALDQLGLSHIDPRAPMSALGPGDQMLIRIAGTLIAQPGAAPAWLYVMDEPTAALTGAESDRLFAVIDRLIAQGAGVLYVSHRMPEVLRLSHRVTVLRDGQRISTHPIADTDQGRIIHDMTGRDLSGLFPPRTAPLPKAPPVLRVLGLSVGPLSDISLDLSPGEILGIGGLAGSGRNALLRAVLGDLPPGAGRITLAGHTLGRHPAQGWSHGIAYIPRERRSEGLMLRRAISENVMLPHLARFARAGLLLDHGAQARETATQSAATRLKSAGPAQAVEELSGGNQQKVLFARALAGRPKVLLLDEPTRGVDIGARFDLYRIIRALSDQGIAMILTSSDLPELIGLSDRIAILQDGRLTGEVPTEALSEAALLARFYEKAKAA